MENCFLNNIFNSINPVMLCGRYIDKTAKSGINFYQIGLMTWQTIGTKEACIV